MHPGKPFGPHFDWARGRSSGRLKLSAGTKRNGGVTADFSSTIEELVDYHFPTENEDRMRNETRNVTHTNVDGRPGILPKGKAVFRSLNNRKASGVGLPLEVIELLFRVNKQLFLALMNKCLKEGVFPSSWKLADLVLFNKTSKDRKVASSYRPICLLSAWSKVPLDEQAGLPCPCPLSTLSSPKSICLHVWHGEGGRSKRATKNYQ